MFAQEWEVDESGENEDLLFHDKLYRHPTDTDTLPSSINLHVQFNTLNLPYSIYSIKTII